MADFLFKWFDILLFWAFALIFISAVVRMVITVLLEMFSGDSWVESLNIEFDEGGAEQTKPSVSDNLTPTENGCDNEKP